ncbi:uncharacterized protein [Littorina saxatilis]|uniref:uncharacterized protein n=1 Tax=Littorina saxatilis TaxID=31220 RepID=UPI0038B4FAB5
MHKKSGSFTLPQHPETALPSTPPTSQQGTTSDNLHLLLKPLRSKVEVQAFLKAIREHFINKVNVLEPGGFADLLIERGVLTETDNESIGAGHHPTRKEQARRVWTILYGIRHEVLVHDVLPVLCKRHSHIIPESFWISDHSPHDSPAGSRGGSGASVGVEGGGCTRCEIRRRLRPSTLADFLWKAGVMSFDVYSDLTRHQRKTSPDYVWNTIFREFTKLSTVDAQRLQLDMTSLLTRHSLLVPDDIVDLMTEGFLCCCSLRSGTATRSMLFHLETLSLRRPSHDSTASDTSSSGSSAVSSKESSVKLSSAKRQADVPSSLRLESSSDITTEDLCVVESSPQSSAGSSVSSEGSSVKLSSPQSFASPVSLFSSASSDDEKLKNFRKALTRDYERHRSVLHGTAPFSGQKDDDVISANDVISPDDVMVDVFFDKEDGSTRQPDSSGGDLSSRFNRLLDASTSLDQRSTEGSHADQDDFISQTVERVKKNRDLQEFRSIVASDVNSAEKLREGPKGFKIVIVIGDF